MDASYDLGDGAANSVTLAEGVTADAPDFVAADDVANGIAPGESADIVAVQDTGHFRKTRPELSAEDIVRSEIELLAPGYIPGPCLLRVAAHLPIAELLNVRSCSSWCLAWATQRATPELHELQSLQNRIRARLWVERVASITKDTADETVFETKVRNYANEELRHRMEAEMSEAKVNMERQIHAFQVDVDRRMEEQAVRMHAIIEERVHQQISMILSAEMEKVRTMAEERVQERVRQVLQHEVLATVHEMQSRLTTLATENDQLRNAFIEHLDHSDLCYRSLVWALNPNATGFFARSLRLVWCCRRRVTKFYARLLGVPPDRRKERLRMRLEALRHALDTDGNFRTRLMSLAKDSGLGDLPNPEGDGSDEGLALSQLGLGTSTESVASETLDAAVAEAPTELAASDSSNDLAAAAVTATLNASEPAAVAATAIATAIVSAAGRSVPRVDTNVEGELPVEAEDEFAAAIATAIAASEPAPRAEAAPRTEEEDQSQASFNAAQVEVGAQEVGHSDEPYIDDVLLSLPDEEMAAAAVHGEVTSAVDEAMGAALLEGTVLVPPAPLPATSAEATGCCSLSDTEDEEAEDSGPPRLEEPPSDWEPDEDSDDAPPPELLASPPPEVVTEEEEARSQDQAVLSEARDGAAEELDVSEFSECMDEVEAEEVSDMEQIDNEIFLDADAS